MNINKYTIIVLLLISGMLIMASCAKKGDAILEEKVGSYNFTTYTVDTLRLRVTVNDQNLGDSLLSPVGSLRSNISFLDSVASLRVFNAETNELIIDTTIILRIGFSTISIVQLSSGQRPFIQVAFADPVRHAQRIDGAGQGDHRVVGQREEHEALPGQLRNRHFALIAHGAPPGSGAYKLTSS